MKIRKSVQVLMPYGAELILQGHSKKDIDIKLSIKKRFDSNFVLDEWHKKHKETIKDLAILIENTIKNL